MKRGNRSLVALALLASVGCDSRPSARPSSVETGPHRLATAGTPARPSAPAPLEFVEEVTGGAETSDPLPLIIAIHGLGDRPAAFIGLFDGFGSQARILAPAGPDPYGGGHTWFPFKRDGDEARLARGIRAAAERIAAFSMWAVKNRPTVGRPIVTGFSQGGMLSFGMALEHPGDIAAALPVGGLVPTPLLPSAAPENAPPIIAFHGESDAVVPFEPTAKAAARLEGLGYSIEFHPFPGVGHSIPPAMRAALHDALASQVARTRP